MGQAQRHPSFARLEKALHACDRAAAVDELIAILEGLQRSQASFLGFGVGPYPFAGSKRELYRHLCTRFAAAYGQIVTAPGFDLAGPPLEALFVYHRLSHMMIRCSGFQTGDHLLARLPHNDAGNLVLDAVNLIRFLLIRSPASHFPLDLEQCYRINPLITLLAALGILSARSCVSTQAVDLRERVLEWLPGKLDGLTLGALQLGFASETYMHCSYAFGPNKHAIKADLIAQFRKTLAQAGVRELDEPPPARSRPRVVVVCEQFRSGHSVFRTHSRCVRSLMEGFESIGFGFGDNVDEPARACFTRFESFSPGDAVPAALATAERIVALQPDIVFFLGVGMTPVVIALAALRLAPVQCVSYGHTATTMSPTIDYMILPDDFIGEGAVYSETLLRFPPESIPYAPPDGTEPAPPPRVAREPGGVTRVAVPASVMKINARFLQALAKAEDRSDRPIEFHFLPAAASGFAYHHLELEVHKILPDAVVFEHSDRQTYLERLGACDFFVSPFPYGNMNSIVDAVIMGLPGVCLDGPEAHSHADLAIFRRLGLPEALCAKNEDEYVGQIARLADEPSWLAECRRLAGEIDLEATMYQGDERLFCQEMLKLVQVQVAT